LDFEFDIKTSIVEFFLWLVLSWGLRYLMGLEPTLLSFLPSTWQGALGYIVALVIVFLIFFGLSMRRTPVAGLIAYLFLPKNTICKKLKDYEPYQHRVIVNTKKIPAPAYPLMPGSYAWNLVKRHPELVYVEVDEAPTDSDHDRHWCEERGYRYEPKSPSREDLLGAASIGANRELDPKLDHVQARFFYLPFLSRSTSKRCLLNYSTMKAFTYDGATWRKLEGTIRVGSGYWWPIPHYVQRWAKKQGFEWSDKVPTPEDLRTKEETKK
jgi:hypothetical protein